MIGIDSIGSASHAPTRRRRVVAEDQARSAAQVVAGRPGWPPSPRRCGPLHPAATRRNSDRQRNKADDGYRQRSGCGCGRELLGGDDAHLAPVNARVPAYLHNRETGPQRRFADRRPASTAPARPAPAPSGRPGGDTAPHIDSHHGFGRSGGVAGLERSSISDGGVARQFKPAYPAPPAACRITRRSADPNLGQNGEGVDGGAARRPPRHDIKIAIPSGPTRWWARRGKSGRVAQQHLRGRPLAHALPVRIQAARPASQPGRASVGAGRARHLFRSANRRSTSRPLKLS